MYDHLTLLVIDDDAVDRMAVRRALRAAAVPCTIEEAADSDAALAALDARVFDVALMDYRLPDSDGLALLREIRSRGLTLPIIMLTGQGDEQLAVDLLRAGATDYLTKNAVSPDVLAQSIYRAQRIHRAERSAAQAEDALRVADERRHFLAEASQHLVESLDMAVILDRLAELGTRELGDCCVVQIVGDDGQIQHSSLCLSERVDTGHAGPTEAALLAMVAPGQPSLQLCLSGGSLVYPALDLALAEQASAMAAPYLALGFPYVIAVPLTVRGQAIGAIILLRGEGRPPFDADELRLAGDLAHRAAIALDNARLYHEAQEAVRVRDAFLSVAAHELKTPLTTLYGNVQLLQRRSQREGTLNERDQRTLRIIFEQTGRLNKMITALLDLSRLQMGQFSIQPQPLDLAVLSRRVVDELQLSLERHLVSLDGVDSAAMVLGDELRLEQVIQNLIQNAIKYSPGGGLVQVRLVQDGANAILSVSDQGIGIPQSAIPNLFRRFYRASNVHDHHISGIGVGLFVVNEIVGLHGGRITVASTEGVGTTFTVYLPLAALP